MLTDEGILLSLKSVFLRSYRLLSFLSWKMLAERGQEDVQAGVIMRMEVWKYYVGDEAERVLKRKVKPFLLKVQILGCSPA